MHIHILGICGTFMGGVAALAREAGHKVTGCDAGVYPPMSDQLRALGIDLIEGFGADQMALKPDVWVVGNVVSRARLPTAAPKFPLMEAILDAGRPTPAARSGWLNTCCRAGMCWPWQAHTAKPPPRPCWPGFWNTPGCSRASWWAACH
jgi:hypothetical protein